MQFLKRTCSNPEVKSINLQKWYLILLFCLGFSTGTQAQNTNFISRYINRLLYDTSQIDQPQFMFYPTLAYAPETSWELGLSGLYVYYARRDTSNRLSEINGFAFYTLQNQYGLYLDHSLNSHRNKWIFPGRLRYQSFPLLYHGISPDSPAEFLARVDANLVQVRERALRRIIPNLYTGIEMDFQKLGSVTFNSESDIPPPLPVGGRGSTNLAFGLGMLYDNRHNVLNVRNGFFRNSLFLNMPGPGAAIIILPPLFPTPAFTGV